MEVSKVQEDHRLMYETETQLCTHSLKSRTGTGRHREKIFIRGYFVKLNSFPMGIFWTDLKKR